MYARYKVMWGCKYFISPKSIHSSLLSWRDRYLKKLKDKSQNAQSRRSGEKSHHIYEICNNTVMPHGLHMYSIASDTAKATMCTYPQYDHALPHWKFELRYCAECQYIMHIVTANLLYSPQNSLKSYPLPFTLAQKSFSDICSRVPPSLLSSLLHLYYHHTLLAWNFFDKIYFYFKTPLSTHFYISIYIYQWYNKFYIHIYNIFLHCLYHNYHVCV